MPTVDVINPSVVNTAQNQEISQDEPGPIQTVVGIIYPPPEVRSILFRCFSTEK